MKDKKQTRRYFIKSAIVGLTVGLAILWDKMVTRNKVINTKRNYSLIFNPNDKISFQEDFIIVNTGDKLKVLSSRCTHLGCKINHEYNLQLLCPCHGSSFDLEGNVVKGPAVKPLQLYDYKLDKDTNIISVKV